MNIARVFPTKTKFSPVGPDCFFGPPDMFQPLCDTYNEVHISTVFTWDIPRALFLKKQWAAVCPIVKIGGPAFDDAGTEFEPGRYIKNGVTITSRGCPNNCPFCFVPRREGKIRELEIKEGNIVQDNNLLACSKQHVNRVFEMLKKQKAVEFKGGFEPARVTDEVVEQLRNLSIREIWLSYDMPKSDKFLKMAVSRLSKYFPRYKLRCYVLVGFEGDTIPKALDRCRRAWEIGTLPFVQRLRLPTVDKNSSYFQNDKDWIKFSKEWSRPAATKKIMAGVK